MAWTNIGCCTQTSKYIPFLLLEMLKAITDGPVFFYSITPFQRTSLSGHFQYCRPLWVMTFLSADSSNTVMISPGIIVFNNNRVTNLMERLSFSYKVLRNYATVSKWMSSTFVVIGSNLIFNASRIWSNKMHMEMQNAQQNGHQLKYTLAFLCFG